MIVGVLRETKTDEYRVALLPVGAALLVSDGHRVLVEAGAGAKSGFSDEDYASAVNPASMQPWVSSREPAK